MDESELFRKGSHPAFSPPTELNIKIWRYMDLTQFVSMLEERGLLRQVADPLHSRKQRLELTCEGSTSMAATKARQRQRLEQQLSGWPQEDVDTFGELFWRFVSGLG